MKVEISGEEKEFAGDKGKFTTLTTNRSTKSIFPKGSKPCIYVGVSNLYISQEIYESLGLPTYLSLGLHNDPRVKQIKLAPASPSNPHSRKVGNKRYKSLEDVQFHSIRIPNGKDTASSTKKMERGYYVPQTGGVFEYSSKSAPLY